MRLEPQSHTQFQIIAIANRLTAAASQAYLRSFGIGVMEWRVIAMLALTGGTTAHEISQISGVDKSAVSRAGQSLIRRELIASREDPQDSRRSLLSLTGEGRALHDRIIRASLAREKLLLEGFSGDERDELFRLMGKLMENLPKVEAHDPAAEA
jgi:DNA-binding MarR family transcriptional regulator